MMRAVIIVPIVEKTRAEIEFAKDFPNGGRECFARGLSITGDAPATHRIVCPIVTAPLIARIQAKFAAIPGAIISTYDPDTTPNGSRRAIANAGLKLIRSAI